MVRRVPTRHRGKRSPSRAPGQTGVLFVNTAILPPLGADSWVHAQIIRNLDRSTHELHVACVTETSGSSTVNFAALREIPGLHVRSVNFGPEFSHRAFRGKIRAFVATLPFIPSLIGLARYVRTHQLSILHTSGRPRDAFASIVLARLTGAKCVVHLHVSYNPQWMGRLVKWSLRRADAVVGVSQFVADSVAPCRPDTSTTHVVLNAIDVAEWQSDLDREEIRRGLGVPEAAAVVLTACRLFPEKGPGELIRAVAAIRHRVPEAHLLIAGDDVTPDRRYAAELVELTRELGVEDRVAFLGRRSDVNRLMAAADVFAMPSHEEPFGLVYLEAMAMRLPVVALDDGGTPEVVEHGKSGLLSTYGDVDSLADNLSSVLLDPELRARMGDHGRRRVVESFNCARLGEDMAKVYQRVIVDA